MKTTTQPLPMRDAFALARRGVADTVHRTRSPKGRPRGIALMMVLIMTGIIAALSVQFTYHTRTNLWMSGNLLASTQAQFNARSAMKIGLLAVNAKKNFPEMQKFLGLMGKAAAQRLEVWQRACDFVNIFATGKAEFFGMALLDFTSDKAVGGKRPPQAKTMLGAMGLEGDDDAAAKAQPAPFTCKVSAEDGRVNLNRAATEAPAPAVSAGGQNLQQAATAMLAQQQRAAAQLYVQLGGLLQPMAAAGFFESDERAVELILNIIDWTDADDQKSDIDQSGNFVAGSGAEGGDYRQYGYQSKNAKMDTVGEVQLVEGMTSDVYCRIRDKLTVFATDKVNVNDADVLVIKGILCQAIQNDIERAQLCLAPGPKGIPPMDEAIIAMESCRQIKKQVYSTPFMSMNTFNQFFRQYPTSMGTGIPFNINTSIVDQQLGVRTKMVRLEAMGVYGHTKRKMVAIVDTSTGALVNFHYE
ncbi:MAG: hypothetical protein CVU56_18805 [Deltaproteobacteria bacterium HGW-Deltaproteobacteria-14]|jgi:hypothetical protein|nr:MAG: hypothetical protein CVU56_18805 [Deltaproteobacteria bacterium HGW-Deltaproteobacteria-14]